MKKFIDRIDLELVKVLITGTFSKNLNVSQKDQSKFIKLFLSKKMVFDENTPAFILKNDKCILSSINEDITSAKYLSDHISEELKNQIIEIALEKPFALNLNYPIFLATNYNIILNSIKIDCYSINSIRWYLIEDKYQDSLIEELVNSNYVLNVNSPIELMKDPKIILSSIKKNIESLEYAIEYQDNPEIMEYLLNHGSCNIEDLKNYQLSVLDSYEKVKIFFNNMPSLKNLDSPDKEKLVKLFYEAIHTKPTITSFHSIFQVAVESKWNEYKKQKAEMYENIFGKICSELKSKTFLEEAKQSLSFLEEMKKMLGEKYQLIDSAIEKYFNIYHSNLENKLEMLEEYRDIIAELSALYISKSKENFKKIKIEDCYSAIKPFFLIKENHPFIKKNYMRQAQKKKFYILYLGDNEKIERFISSLKEKYKDKLPEYRLNGMINGFIIGKNSKINQILEEPYCYQDYLRYKKAKKLINRLNSHYISIDGPEVKRYLHLISYDKENDQYSYRGLKFKDRYLKECEEYERMSYIFKKIKQDISKKVSELEINEYDLKRVTYRNVENQIPFNDKFFDFNLNLALNIFRINDLYEYDIKNIFNPTNSEMINEESYQNLRYILVEQGIFWLHLLLTENQIDKSMFCGLEYLDPKKYKIIPLTINKIDKITALANRFHMDIQIFDKFILLTEVSSFVDEQKIGILGVDLTNILMKKMDYTSRRIEQIVENAANLASIMTTKDKFTVPRVEGESSNYRYSIYDQQDFSVFLAGINTNACFKADGIDNDFFHYCLLDKNGFILKIEDTYGKFIARAGGFRHGNCIFINQLRSIYDISMNELYGFSDSENNEIINTLKKACDDIISTSQKNEKEQCKIDYIFITQSYLLKKYSKNVVDNLLYTMNYLMDIESEDWRNFISSTPNIRESRIGSGFNTDFGNYSIICVSSVDEKTPIMKSQLKLEDVEALYRRKRNDIIAVSKTDLDNENLEKIDRTLAIYTKNHNVPYIPIEIEEDSIIIMGDNWYITCNNEEITNSCFLEEDKEAEKEFKATYLTLIEELESNKLDINTVKNKVYSKS